MKVIDTHQHLWDMERFRYSWLDEVPALRRSFLIDDYREATKNEEASEVEIAGTVHIEADVDEPHLLDETRWILSLAEQPEHGIQGVVAGCRPECADFPAHLEQIAEHSALKGVRRVLFSQPETVWLSSLFVENLQLLPAFGLSFDLCVFAGQLVAARELVSHCPEVSFILDHCGVPPVGEGTLEPWASDLAELAKRPNVVCKISGLPAYASRPDWTVEELRPFFEVALASFGTERVLWGSDWPVCTRATTPRRWLEASLEMAAGLSEVEKSALFAENARRVYRL